MKTIHILKFSMDLKHLLDWVCPVRFSQLSFALNSNLARGANQWCGAANEHWLYLAFRVKINTLEKEIIILITEIRLCLWKPCLFEILLFHHKFKKEIIARKILSGWYFQHSKHPLTVMDNLGRRTNYEFWKEEARQWSRIDERMRMVGFKSQELKITDRFQIWKNSHSCRLNFWLE